MAFIDYKTAMELLHKAGCSADVIDHCIAVSSYAYEIAFRIEYCGHPVDKNLVRLGGLLHDIGRAVTNDIDHAVTGARIAREYGLDERLVNIIERHIGAGITRSESIALGLPVKSYLPDSIEEKIVAHADNLVHGKTRVTIETQIDRMRKRGIDEPLIERMLKLDDFIKSRMDCPDLK